MRTPGASWRRMHPGFSVAVLMLVLGVSGCGNSPTTRPVAHATATSTSSLFVTPTISGSPAVTQTVSVQPSPTGDPSLCHPADTAAPLPTTLASAYAGTIDGDVIAVNASNGTLRWRYSTGISALPAFTVTSTLLYVTTGVNAPSGSGLVVALGTADGAVHWRAQYPGGPDNSGQPMLFADNGTVYVIPADHSIYALNGASGAQIWHVQVTGGFNHLTVVNGTVYATSAGSTGLYALRATDGAQLWTSPVPAFLSTVANGLIYGSDQNGTDLVALDISTRAVRWRFQTGSPFAPSGIESVSLAGSGAYVNAGHFMYALNASTGALCWQSTACGQIATSGPVLAGGALYATCFLGDPGPGSAGPGCGVFALDANTGISRWTLWVTGFPQINTGSLVNGTLYAGGLLQVAAVNASSGTIRWSFPATPQPRLAFSQASVVGSTVFAGGPDGRVYALNIATGAPIWSTSVSGTQVATLTMGP
ncbi:MAG TPA: PQQ-binding-like beta-propeller repeat protein [Ktedonobacterales bacterium]